ncbi:energy transducer TonB [Arenimonas sp.]|uniref:energy transducer TonB n=1 Tax=Arenimonas sp. TaxID=1872635 RepID=UPI002E34C2C3|nr:energy transducer TonB [Arenimonas sp.]HEX4853093.1 energy transducer TonB [Arenimonas sp.]
MSPSLALALALAASAPPAATAADVAAAAPEWLEVAPQASPDPKALWEQLSTRRALRSGVFNENYPPREKDIRMHATRVHMVEPEGELAGDWTFLGAEGGTRPHAGYRLRWDGASGYRWIAELHCEPGAGCEAAQAHFAAMLAPRPPDPARREAWLEIIATEPCTPGPVHTPAPRYPMHAARNQVGGVVLLALLANRCGDVRDAWVLESSGHQEIDRASVEAARNWKALPPEDGRATATLRVPISFGFPEG